MTEGFIERFGAERVMETPIVEETIAGMALGSGDGGHAPGRRVQYADFMSSGYDEITTASLTTTTAAAARSRRPAWSLAAGPRVELPLDEPRAVARVRSRPEGHLPGVPHRREGAAEGGDRDDNPCVYLEHKWIYRASRSRCRRTRTSSCRSAPPT